MASDFYFSHNPWDHRLDLEKSAYYWWYRFMQKVKGYGPNHALWDDFGDVRQKSEYVEEDFWYWWLEHQTMFEPRGSLGVWEQETDADVKAARKEGAFIVSVDPNETRDRLMFDFDCILKEKGIGNRRGRRPHKKESQGKHSFIARPDHRSLRLAFLVYEAYERRKVEKTTLYKIGEQLGVNKRALVTDDMKADVRRQKKNIMNVMVTRHYKNALSIIKHIGKGEFPVLAKNTNTRLEAADK